MELDKAFNYVLDFTLSVEKKNARNYGKKNSRNYGTKNSRNSGKKKIPETMVKKFLKLR